MDKKYLKLGLIGLVVFAVLLGVILLYFGAPAVEAEPGQGARVLLPYFVEEFDETYPGVVENAEVKFKFRGQNLTISGSGFLEGNGTIFPDNSVTINVRNADEVEHNLVVLSPGLDGGLESVFSEMIPAGEVAKVQLFVPAFIGEIISSGKVELVKSEDGENALIFQLVCNVNCEEENNTIKIFTPIQ